MKTRRFALFLGLVFTVARCFADPPATLLISPNAIVMIQVEVK